jgi:hypothetical protein
MGKLRYTRNKMEEIIFTQLDSLLAIGEQVTLLKQQTELLNKVNMELREELIQYNKAKERSQHNKESY